jgi:hypothetical protein
MPPGYTWHHVEDSDVLELLPTAIHRYVSHTGSAAQIIAGELVP